MKKQIFIALGLLLLFSCEDVVSVELPTDEPRLVIDGLLRVDKSQEFIDVEIKVTETSDFFQENPVTQVENASIVYGRPTGGGLFDSISSSSLVEREPGSGVYIPDPNASSEQRIRTAAAEPGIVFILQLEHKERRYLARTEYSASVPLDNVRQGTETLFDEDDIEVVVTFTDNPDQNDFYVFDFDFGEFQALDDQFFQGQQFQFSYFYSKNLQVGQSITISILGANLDFFNYMDLLVEQTEDNGGVFETPITTVRGNVFDVTDLDNINIFDNVGQPDVFALGYFAVVQEFSQTITIE
jgi:hypothetical protein